MSDVSGIPYMGPMGQGNFFAPTFSYNPQMTAGQISSSYMPEIYNNQNVLNNLYGGGANAGFGRLTDYYSQLGANQLSGIGSTNPYGVFSNTGQSARAPAFNQGAIDNFVTGGGGFNFPSVPNYSGGVGGSYGLGEGLGSSGFNTTAMQNLFGNWNAPQPQIDWTGGGGGGGLFSSLGGLGGAPYTPSPGGSALDWTHLFGGGGGGARADPYPNMAMPGGLSSPMTLPQQQPLDYGSLFGRGVGGTGGAPETPQPSAPSPPEGRLASLGGLGGAPYTPQPGGSSFDWTKLFGGGAEAAPAAPTPPAAGSSVFDTGAPPITGVEGAGAVGGGRGVGGLGQGDTTGAPYTAPAEPNRYPLTGPPVTEAYNPYFDVTSPYSPRSGGEVVAPGGGLTATDLSEQARTRLADLMAGAKEPTPDEIFAGDKSVPTEGQPAVAELLGEAGRGGMVGRPADPYDKLAEAIPLPRPRPAGAPAAESDLRSRQEALNTLKQELQTNDLVMTSGYRDPTNPLSRANPASAHSQGRAFDVRARTPEQADAAMNQIRGLLNPRGLVEGQDYRIIDEVRHPSGWATGPHVHTQFTEEGMRKYQQQVYRDPFPDANPPRPPADIPVPIVSSDNVPPTTPPGAESTVPLPMARPAEAPARESQVNQGQDVLPRPPADIPDPRVSGAGFNALDAAAGPSGVQKAQSFLNRSLESILQQYSPENLSKAGWVMDIKQPLREALKGPFGSQILSGLQPKLGSLGLTQSDFSKAVADPRARFAGGGDDSTRAQVPTAGSGTASSYWDIPKEGTPRYNAEVYEPAFGGFAMRRPEQETTGGAGHYADFPRTGNVEDRRNEVLGRDQLAALKAMSGGGFYDAPGPEPAATPLSNALGLGNLPTPRGSAPAGMMRPQGIAGDVEDNALPTPEAPGWSDWFSNLDKQLGNPFVSPAAGADARQAAGRTNLEAMFGGSEGRMAEYSTRIDAMAPGADMPANTKFNLLGAAYDTKGKILDQVQELIANRDWPAVDAAANSRLVGGGQLGIQFGGAGEQPVFHPDMGGDAATEGPALRAALAELQTQGSSPWSDVRLPTPSGSASAPASTFAERFRGDVSPSDRYSDALYGRATNPVDDAIKESMTAAGMDFPHWKAIAEIESSLNPELNKDQPTQYKGLYQIGSRATDPEWATHGMGDIYNPMDNALAAARMFQSNREWFSARYGRDPTPGEAYLMHNQGRGFFTNNTLTNAAGNAPAGYGFRLPPTHDTFLEDWNRRVETGAAKYR
jgi:hypothetical protein